MKKKVPGSEETDLINTGKTPIPSLLIPLLFITVTFIIYLPVINRYFVSDDFKVMYRVCRENILFIKDFFRPLSDLSIWMNYKLGGLNPMVFNSFNILIHGMNGYLVYVTCLCFGHKEDKVKNRRFAIFSSAIFLCYPFHNEAVVWLLGRGASMACLFSLLALISYYKMGENNWKHFFVCFFYFISISAFESTIFLPLIFLLVLISEQENLLVIRKWAGLLVLTLILHLILRFAIAGSLLGTYGQDFFSSGLKMYLLNITKVGGRLLLPPSRNANLLTGIFILLIVAIGVFILKNLSKIKQEPILRNILILSGMLFISCVIPVLSGVSTQTSETDRALYFPSVFLSMIIGDLMVHLIKKFRTQYLLMAMILSYNLILLEKNNLNWKKASSVTQMIVEKINEKNRPGNSGRIFFLNIPNEIEGAYVFRQGFQDALKLNGYDSNRYFAVNYLSRQDLEKMKKKIFVESPYTETFLLPDILIKQDTAGCREIYDHGQLKFTSRPGDQIYYWNVDKLEPVQACAVFSPGS